MPSAFFFFQAEDGIRDLYVTGVQTCALPICGPPRGRRPSAPRGRATGPRRRGAPDRSEERRVGKSVDLGGRRIIKKKKKNSCRADVQFVMPDVCQRAAVSGECVRARTDVYAS